jgi:putative oxidoreductase
LIIPALGGLYNGLANLTYPFLRFCYGAFFIPHGWVKIVDGGVAKYNEAGVLVGGLAGGLAKMNIPAPEAMAWYLGLLELVGGAMLAVGLLTRVVAAQLVGFMAVAAFMVHSETWFWTDKGMEVPLLLMVIGIVILIRGGHHWSIDKALPKEF